MTVAFQSPRVFEVWRYTVSHGQLLLRSNPNATCRTRIEVLFKPVVMMKLPTSMEGLAIRRPTEAEMVDIREDTGLTPGEGRLFFVVEGTNYRGYVISGTMVTSEDELGYADPSGLLAGE